MAVYNKFLSSFGVHTAIQPHDATGAASNGAYFSLKLAEEVIFLLSQGAWAGGTPAVTLEQATTVAGTTSKALGFTQAWTKGSVAGDLWVPVTVVNNTFNLLAVPNTLVAIEVSAQMLDRNNGYTCVRLVVGTPGVNADLLSAVAIFRNERYENDPSLVRSHLLD